MHAFVAAALLAAAGTVELPATLTAPVCVACAAPSADDAPGLARLRAGEAVLTLEDETDAAGAPRRVAEVTTLLFHRPSQVWTVLADFARRPAWQPGVHRAAVVRSQENRVWVDEWARFFFVDVHYRLALTLDPENGEIHFAMDEESPHDIGGARGHWRLRAVDDGRRTLVTYRAWIDFGHGLPRTLQSWLLRYSLPRLLDNLREESDRRLGTNG